MRFAACPIATLLRWLDPTVSLIVTDGCDVARHSPMGGFFSVVDALMKQIGYYLHLRCAVGRELDSLGVALG